MSALKIEFPDGTTKEFDSGTTPLEIAQSISPQLAKKIIVASFEGKLVDLDSPLQASGKIKLLTPETPEGLEVIRHSTAHLLAHAVKELYPETQITIGPVTEDGFYYDFERAEQFTPADLKKIEKRMEQIKSKAYDVSRKEWSSQQELAEHFKKAGEPFKAEIILDLKEGPFSTYQQGDFEDLCRGPHVPNTKKLGKFKLLSLAGAYWRGDEKNQMLQRIYGTAFATQEELDLHLHRLEEAKKRDHRKLGPEMELFNFLPIAPAMPFYLPKGSQLYNVLLGYMREEMLKTGYQEVICPQLMGTDLWKTSGHLDHYRDNMFFTASEDEKSSQTMGLKPMNCPGHVALFGTTKHSYRELPIRLCEFSKLHRNERAGVTHGLLRTRAFSQDDGHIFCTPEQLEQECLDLIRHTQHIYNVFGFKDLRVVLAKRDDSDKFMGTQQTWEKSTRALEESLIASGVAYETELGEAAFYGPKIEFHVKDSLGRSWQCGTIQLDFNLPERFGIEYIDSQSKSQQPVMIHRAILGSFERFMGILIEHYAGHLPLWCAPTQARVLTLSENFEAYAKQVHKQLMEKGIRVELDIRSEKLGKKIREAQLQKVPLMVIIGADEVENQTISVRYRDGHTDSQLQLNAFFESLHDKLKPGGSSH